MAIIYIRYKVPRVRGGARVALPYIKAALHFNYSLGSTDRP